MTRSEQLIQDLHTAFGYTDDNNRDLLGDETFPMKEVTEELEVQKAWQFLVAYTARNKEMIDANFEIG